MALAQSRSPFDNPRRKTPSPAVIAAASVSIGAHVALAALLAVQRFVTPVLQPVTERIIEAPLVRFPDKPPPPAKPRDRPPIPIRAPADPDLTVAELPVAPVPLPPPDPGPMILAPPQPPTPVPAPTPQPIKPDWLRKPGSSEFARFYRRPPCAAAWKAAPPSPARSLQRGKSPRARWSTRRPPTVGSAQPP
jgi:periplasmic protein TonB